MSDNIFCYLIQFCYASSMEKQNKNQEEKFEKVHIPKVKVNILTPEQDTNRIIEFCLHKNPSIDFRATVYNRHPELKKMVEGVEDEKKFSELCKKYVFDFKEKNKKIIELAKESFQIAFEEVCEKIITILTKDFETTVPNGVKEIKANISINPICPRWLDNWQYNVFYKFSSDIVKEVSIHEIIHFLYFRKWKEVFPDSERKNFDAMYPEWILSEILVHTIINNNKALQEIIKNEKTDVYIPWRAIRLDGKKLPEYFAPFYIEHEDGKISFADFLKKSWEAYNKNKLAIEESIIKK